jgi:hypothetical protein
MNTQQDDGGPAFPRPASEYTPNDAAFDIRVAAVPYTGMALRDYFAAAALQGWLTTYGEDTPHPGLDETNGKAYMKSLAQCSYEMANAMLAARKEGA